MKKVVLTQRFQFYVISPYKDYSRLEDRESEQIREDFGIEMDNVSVMNMWSGEVSEVKTIKHKGAFRFPTRAETKKRTKYFYSDRPNDTLRLEPWSQKHINFYTTDERHLKKHYGRAFSEVSTKILERSITVDEDSISVRYYTHTKHRGVNSLYFRKSRTALGFKFNFKTGNITAYDGTTKKPVIRQNGFAFLEVVINNFFVKSRSGVVHEWTSVRDADKNKLHPMNVEYNKLFNDDEFMDMLSHVFLSRLPHNKNILDNKTFHTQFNQKTRNMFLDCFVETNGLKVPNEYYDLLCKWYPTKKFLKKNDNKLIASILDRVGLKSKSMIKLLHKFPNADIRKLLVLAKYFGYQDLHKYIHNIDVRFLLVKAEDMDAHYYGTNYDFIRNKFEYDLRDSEKTCILKLINELMYEFDDDMLKEASATNTVRNQINQINDHLSLVTKIREYIPETEMRASNFKDFHTEHIEFSKIDRMIKKGYSIKYLFEDQLVEYIEKPIQLMVDDDETIKTFYPVLLKIDGEYSEEGAHMHHCVATYADRENSIIVSLREDSPQGSERVTNEFSATTKACVQSKYFCNAAPPERFVHAVEILKSRVASYRGSIKSISKEKIPLVINGVEIMKSDETELGRFIAFNDFLNGI